jgi:serine/threonine-protein kinase HipA
MKLGLDAKLSKKLIEEIIDQTKGALDGWNNLANNHHVAKVNIDLITKAINGLM